MCKAKIKDFYSVNSFHEMFNISFILLCGKIFSEVDVELGKSTYDNLICLIESNRIELPKNISFKISKVFEKDSKLGALMRILLGSFSILYKYIFISKADTLILNYSNVFAFPFILICNRFIRKKVLITFHGELELLSDKSLKKYKLSFLYSIIYKFSFRYLLSGSNIRILVLGASIKNSVVQLYPLIKDNIISINHPYLFQEEVIYSNKEDSSKCDILTIGILGYLDEKRGLCEFLQLAEYFKEQIKEGKLVLKSIGKRPANIDIKEWNFIQWGPEGVMPRNDFERNVYSLDYILCLYPVDSYNFTASGVAMDALRFMKPIIALQNNYLQTITSGYKIGFQESTLDKIKEIILAELHTKTDTEIFSSDLWRMRTLFDVSYNANLLKNSLFC